MRPVARRDFARGLALAGMALPFLRILGVDPLGSSGPLARAGGGTAPKRFVFFYVPDGISSVTGDDSSSSGNGWRTDLGRMASGPKDFTLGTFTAPLAPLQKQLVMLQGLDMHDPVVADTHQQGQIQVLTANGFDSTCGTTKDCVGNGATYGVLNASLDAYIQTKMPASTRLMNLAVQPNNGNTISFSGPGFHSSNQPISDPVVAFNTLFSEVGAGDGGVSSQLALQNTLRKSVLDNVRSEIATLDARLGSEDRQRLQAHLQSITDVESQLKASTGQCSKPVAPAYPSGSNGSNFADDDNNYSWIARNHWNVVAAAFACDLTRVVTFQNRACYSQNNACPFVGLDDDLHNMSHFSQGYSGFVKSRAYLYSQLFYFADLLSKTPEPGYPGQTLLDNTIILSNSDIAEGHQHQNACTFTIGGANLGVNVGTYIGFGNNHQPYGNLFVSILNALGIADTTWFTTGTGPLAAVPGGGPSFLRA